MSLESTIADLAARQKISDLQVLYCRGIDRCDIDTLQALYAPDVEFFHDLNGRMMNRDQFLQAVRKNICGKLQRRPLPDTMEVYPLAKVGALQMGRHCFVLAGQADCIQQGRYTIFWRFDGTAWQIAKVFSYDHRPMAPR